MSNCSRYLENVATRLIFGHSTDENSDLKKTQKEKKMSAPEAKKAKLEQDDHAGSDQNKPMTHRPNIILAI